MIFYWLCYFSYAFIKFLMIPLAFFLFFPLSFNRSNAGLNIYHIWPYSPQKHDQKIKSFPLTMMLDLRISFLLQKKCQGSLNKLNTANLVLLHLKIILLRDMNRKRLWLKELKFVLLSFKKQVIKNPYHFESRNDCYSRIR